MNDINAISEFEQSLGKMNPEITLSAAQAVFLSDWRSILPRVQVPTTIIQSKTDYIVPENVALCKKQEMGDRHAKVHILTTQGHFPQSTAHSMLLKVLKHALASSE